MLLKFSPKYVHFNGLQFSCALEGFSIISQLWAEKCKTLNFEENKGLVQLCFRNEAQVISNQSSPLKKHQTSFLFKNNFYEFFNNPHFPHF